MGSWKDLLTQVKEATSKKIVEENKLTPEEKIEVLKQFEVHLKEQLTLNWKERSPMKDKYNADIILVEFPDKIIENGAIKNKPKPTKNEGFSMLDVKMPMFGQYTKTMYFAPSESMFGFNVAAIVRGSLTEKYQAADEDLRSKYPEYLSQFLKHHNIKSLNEFGEAGKDYYINYSFNAWEVLKNSTEKDW